VIVFTFFIEIWQKIDYNVTEGDEVRLGQRLNATMLMTSAE